MIAFDVTPLQNGHRFRGIGTVVRELSHRLRQQSEVPIEFWGWSGDHPFTPEPPHRAMWLPRVVPRTRFPSLLRQAMRVRSMASRAHAVHITDPNALTAIAKCTMTTVYDLIPLHRGDSSPIYRSYLEALKSVPVIFAISEATADDLVASLEIPRERIVLARPGVVLPGLNQLPPPPVDPPFFLYVGSPDPHKNLRVLVDALHLCAELPERLAVAGDWPLEEVARIVGSAEPGRVVHLGYVPAEELLAAMQASTAVVLPSLTEGFGLPVAEAMAAGAAVIHSKLKVMEEISAGCALTFDASSPEQLAVCLRTLSRDDALRRDLQARGRRRAHSLTWDAAVRSTLDVYQSLLSRRQVSS